MTSRRTSLPLIIALAAFLVTASNVFGQAGNSGMAFLKLGVSARGVAMSDAMTALARGAEATYDNPAGIFASRPEKSAELLLMHKEWVQGTRMEFLGGTAAIDNENAVGLAVNSTTVSDIEIRTRPGPAEGTFSSQNFSAGLSFAHRFSPGLRAGIAAKFLYEKILINEGSGFALDAGVQMQTPIENVSVGAAVMNIGSMGALANEGTKLPALIRGGAAYALTIDGDQTASSLAGDVVYIIPEHRAYFNAGGELELLRTIVARAGYGFGSEGRGLTAGVGIRYGIIAFDYAYSQLSLDLGSGHTFSLALSL